MQRKIKSMNDNLIYLLGIIKASIDYGGEGTNGYSAHKGQLDWAYIIEVANKNDLLSIIYGTLIKRQEIDHIPNEIIKKWNLRIKQDILLESNKYIAIKRIIDGAQQEGVKPVFFKGCILANLYPQYLLRRSCDTDIFVYERDREKMIALLEGLGYRKNEEHSKNNVPVYFLEGLHHIVELHFALWEDYTGKKINTLKALDLVNEERLIELNICDMTVTTLGYEEHLIYQLFHIIKHFSVDSVGLRYLIDITLYINRYGEHIDYNRVWDKLKQLDYAAFCYFLFELCYEYFDMDQSILKGYHFTGKDHKELLLMDIINSGILYEDKTAAWQILGIMTPYLVGDETVPESEFKRKLKVLFPASKALPEQFGYAKKHKVLLPVAWGHKMINFMIKYRRVNKENNDWYNAREKLNTANYRLNLMKKLGLVEKS